MATKEELKEKFVTGAIPAEEDFHELIDTYPTQEEMNTELSKKANASSLSNKADKSELENYVKLSDFNDLVARVEALEEAD